MLVQHPQLGHQLRFQVPRLLLENRLQAKERASIGAGAQVDFREEPVDEHIDHARGLARFPVSRDACHVEVAAAFAGDVLHDGITLDEHAVRGLEGGGLESRRQSGSRPRVCIMIDG